MSEEPSIYLPRQLRPKRTAAVESIPQPKPYSPEPRVNTAALLTAPRIGTQPMFDISYNFLHVDTTGELFSSVIVSGMLGKQICALPTARRSDMADSEPIICAFLLGYTDSDGTIHLNQLDQGIEHEGRRVPTAVCGTDVAVPLFVGASKSRFYASVIKPGCLYRLAGWISGSGSNESRNSLLVEFINTGVDIQASVLTAPTVGIDSLPSLLAHIRSERNFGTGSNVGMRRGQLQWVDSTSCYRHDTGYLSLPANAIWVDVGDDKQDLAVGNALVEAGAPWSLRVVQISPANDCRTAVLRHTTVAPVSGEYMVAVRLASVELVATSHWTTSTAVLMSPIEYGQGSCDIIGGIAIRSGVKVVERSARANSGMCKSPTTRCQPSPALQRIAAVTHALVASTPNYPERYNKSPAHVPQIRNQPVAAAPVPISAGEGHMVELLEEQRNIRMLLEEQNNLMKAHMSQTKELMRLAQHQPSPQTITRRYLRMKGTHTPVAASTKRPVITDGQIGNSSVRRSNSLSEIVEDIRSFEVEGYEEFEHHAGNAVRRPLSFATPICKGSLDSFSTTSADSSSGISGLVNRINHIVSDSNGNNNNNSEGGSKRAPFGRPPAIPTTNRTVPPAPPLSHGFKITPTTQKYLESFGQNQQQPPPKNRLPAPGPSHR
ncbi:hypothetical protein LPJ73_001270 [Coemansia sp. RSA 2703]|nr:hypothetical protein LPJ73_001270 [Coemansia sp. RSA 2703]KAJ2396022.1 hypothetical protein GGI05_001316 [Coemansia sp. RSA 2603]